MSQWQSSSSSNDMGAMGPGGAGVSRLEAMRAQIQQRQMQEKEAKLLQMLDSQQQRAMQKGNLSGVVPPKYTNNANGPPGNWSAQTSKSKTNQGGPSRATPSPAGSIGAGAGKVRQMFEDRRKGGGAALPPTSLSGGYGGRTLAGIDKSYPLDPLDTSKASMSRSGSSKSDPLSNTYSRGRMPVTNPIPQHSRSRPTPTPPPINVGSSKRGISLDRNVGSRGGSGTTYNHTTASTTTSPVGKAPAIGIRRSTSGFGITQNSRDENANELMQMTSQPPIIPKTTKYRDYASDLESRESELGTKLRQMSIKSPPSPSSTSLSPSQVYGGAHQGPPKQLQGKSTPSMSSAGTIRKTPSKEQATSFPVKRTAPPPGLEECHICHRYFDKDRIAKHETICKKTTTKKRKVFDPTKMRMEGTEAEPYLRQVSAKGPKKATTPAPKKLDWRKKHEEFIGTIRAAKVYSQHVAAGGNPADLPPPPPTDTSDYTQCPHCGRKFSAGAAERHIPKCKDIKSNKNR